MDIQTLSKYLNLFSNLKRNSDKNKGTAPHKPILLLTLLNQIEQGQITTNFVPITLDLVIAFRNNWRAYAPPGWQERLVYPFYYLEETFWDLIKNDVLFDKKGVKDPTSLRQLQEMIDGGRFAPDLWILLQDPAALNELRNFLLGHYFNLAPAEAQPLLMPDPINYEIEKLKAEAHSKYRVKKAKEKIDDTFEYVRHGLFPVVIKSLYEDTCAVCSLAVRTNRNTTIVDAAHIKPFSIFHYSGIENGIALCKNHHWGFDAGWFTISNEYKVIVSPYLQNGTAYITAGSILHLPTDAAYAPDPDALAWHREKRFLK